MPVKGELTGSYVPCNNCGKIIYRTPYRLKKNTCQFCSTQCQKEFEHNQRYEDRPCEMCGKIMHVSKLSSQRFCCNSCQHQWQKTRVGELNPKTKRMDVICDWCGNVYRITPSVYSRADNHFCSNDCRMAWYANICTQSEEWKESSRNRAINMLHNGMVKTVNTKPQIIINELLDNMNIPYRNEESYDHYSVDNYIYEKNLAIEVMGDFWHASPLKYGIDKLYDNQISAIKRDKAKRSYLKNNYNIEVLYLWENDIYNRINVCETLILEFINNNGVLNNYHSFNYSTIDGKFLLNDEIILPYQEQQAIA